MTKVKFYRRIKDAAVLYKINDVSGLNNKLIESVDWPENIPMLGFEFKPVAVDKKPFRVKLSSKYSISVTYCSKGKGLKNIGKSVSQAGIDIRTPKSFSELKRVCKLIADDYYVIGGKYVTNNFKKGSKDFVVNNLKKTRSIIITKNREYVGLFSIFGIKGLSGEKHDLMAWHNLISGLSTAERNSAYYQAAKWMKKTTDKKVFVYVHNFDSASRQFFTGLGFRPYRVIIERFDKK